MNTATKEEGRVIEMPAESFSRAEDRALPMTQMTQPTSLMQAITMAASNPAMDMDKIERLFAMHQKVLAQEAETKFNEAMARAQRNIVPVFANQTNEHTRSTYADLGAITKAIAPMYTAEGLSISFDSNRPIMNADGKPINPPPQGWFRTVAIVSHAAGHSRLHYIDLPSDETGIKGNSNKTAIQGVISMTTYGRRALTCMVFNVAVTDDDGNAEREKQRPEPPARPELPPYAADAFTKNLPAWTKLIKAGKKTATQIIAMVSSKAVLSDEQKKAIEAITKDTAPTFAEIAEKLEAADKAENKSALIAAAELIQAVPDDKERAYLEKMYEDFGGEWE